MQIKNLVVQMLALEARTLFSTFTVTSNADSGAGTLRQAILGANSASGADTIAFDLGSSATQITPVSALPAIAGPLTIDGTTQSGYSNRPVVELIGGSAGKTANGLDMTSGALTLKGLAIESFRNAGVLLDSGSSHSVITQSNIGTDPTGAIDRGNLAGGVVIVGSSSNTIGGAAPSAGNIIAFNGHGAGSIPGVFLYGGGVNNNIQDNSIFSNTGAGIDIAASRTKPDGPLPVNDAGDVDTGTNNLQNKPSITFAGLNSTQTHVFGSLESKPNSSYRIDIYGNPVISNGIYEGQTYITSQTITTDSTGHGAFDTLAAESFDGYFTATATDASGNTSEFATPAISHTGTITGTVFQDLNDNGVQDAGEKALADQIVYLDKNNNGQVEQGEAYAFTNSQGRYTLADAPGGTENLRVVISKDARFTIPSAGFYSVTLPSASTLKRNFGITSYGLIRGSVFLDANNNQIDDNGEANDPGVTIFIDKNNNGVFDAGEKSRVTDSHGDYRFDNLPAGKYVLRVIAPHGFVVTSPVGGGRTITLASAQSLSNRLFGIKS